VSSESGWQRVEFSRYQAWRRSQPSLPEVAKGAPEAGGVERAGAAGPAISIKVFVPLSIFSTLVCVFLALFHLQPEASSPAAALQVASAKGQVRLTDGMQDWPLEVGAEVRAGQTVVTGDDGIVKLAGGDPKSHLVLFEGSSFRLDALEAVPSAGVPAFKMRGEVLRGEVVFQFRSKESLWGVDVKTATESRLICRKVVLFKVAASSKDSLDVVVGDGIVAAVGPRGEKAFIKGDQKMVSTESEPVRKPEGANVLNERWAP
jgi:hypothetical protein